MKVGDSVNTIVKVEDFKQKCLQIEQAYLNQNSTNRKVDDFLKWSKEICEQFINSYNPEVFDIFLSTVLNIGRERKKYQSYILDNFLGTLRLFLFRRLWKEHLPETPMILSNALVETEKNPKHKLMHQRALKMMPFLHELFTIKIPRDSYGNKRKAHAMGLLKLIWDYYDTPTGLEICIEALKTKPEDLVVETAITLTEYHLFRKLPLMEEFIPLLEWQIKHTKHKYVAAQCLDLMKQTKYITEERYRERLYDWKKRNDYPIF